MLKRLLDTIKSKYLKRIMESKNPKKTVEEVEKEICKELNGEDKKRYEKDI